MASLLGIDFGDAVVGLAIARDSDVALPYKEIQNNDILFDELAALITEEQIDRIIVGWPLSMSGRENERTQLTDAFIGKLHTITDRPIEKEDERLSTAEARRGKHKGRVDARAAAALLQSYLDRDGRVGDTV